MSHAEPISQKSVSNIMATRHLVHKLRTWLEDLRPEGPACDPDRLYLIAQQTITESDGHATPKSLLEDAKRNWNQAGTPSEDETMGNLFREWLNQQGLDPQEDLRLTHTIASVFADVQNAIPGAGPDQKLQAVKGLWTAHQRSTPHQPA